MTKQYETVFIMTPVLSEKQIGETVKKYTGMLKKGGAEIVHEGGWGLKKLAYPVQKKSTGFYHCIEFKGGGASIPTLELAFKRDEKILRFLTVGLDKHAVAFNEKDRKKAKEKRKEAKAELKAETEEVKEAPVKETAARKVAVESANAEEPEVVTAEVTAVEAEAEEKSEVEAAVEENQENTGDSEDAVEPQPEAEAEVETKGASEQDGNNAPPTPDEAVEPEAEAVTKSQEA